jgi:hypothetical protein
VVSHFTILFKNSTAVLMKIRSRKKQARIADPGLDSNHTSPLRIRTPFSVNGEKPLM